MFAALFPRSRFRSEALIHAGNNLLVLSLTLDIEKKFGKPPTAVNVATYWRAMRGLDINDKLPGMGMLVKQYGAICYKNSSCWRSNLLGHSTKEWLKLVFSAQK